MQVQTTVNTCNDGPGLVVLLCGDGLIGLIGPLNFSRGLLDPAGTVCIRPFAVRSTGQCIVRWEGACVAFLGTCESTATLNLWVLPTPFAVRKLVAPLVLWRVTPLVSWWFVI